MKHYKAPAKVNIFLKITGKRGEYHEILSRFMVVEQLHDLLYFFPKEEEEEFVIDGDFACTTEQNTIYKAYRALLEATGSTELERLMQTHGIAVNKHIPAFAGLGGGSSDAATYLKMCNEVLHLGLDVSELAAIGAKVGADVPFFVYGYPSANISGIGEIVEPFAEAPLQLETRTPPIEISTPAVYNRFREGFYKELSDEAYDYYAQTDSKTLLLELSADDANDLFEPALSLYPELKEHFRHGWFFSGSGSSFFRPVPPA
ncbi:4-(cytidine 5'-diphospho)-2-C-methyl-D-erythritol kinase [Sulfurimonas sp. HSL-3221]|uniref:4-(cytidine 5'-diphospho)-2-C-methyl-D-erythritol kinase n=1 Tax=Sulfurimonadaceae TaxID=2771471 RepID=UPI001E479EAF|nr:4-(cytidine 5'-diphospho)-2-C-methyl-D-erythritol kinase [Sulfurimonas sp. HSL-3221]UFS63005.1 4-(cytidine 5'-diphospho)-2-C-methyl-D-erythritol kinase [Sulfurimonas sp. HSL-3221]